MACSRMPKWKLRPRVAARLEIAGAVERERVFVEGARSAEPPISQGIFLATAFSTLPDASRPASPLASAGKCRELRLSHAVGQLPALHAVERPPPRRDSFALYASKRARQSARSFAPRAPMPWESARAPRRARETSRPRASRRTAWSVEFPLRPSGSPCAACVSCLVGAP